MERPKRPLHGQAGPPDSREFTQRGFAPQRPPRVPTPTAGSNAHRVFRTPAAPFRRVPGAVARSPGRRLAPHARRTLKCAAEKLMSTEVDARMVVHSLGSVSSQTQGQPGSRFSTDRRFSIDLYPFISRIQRAAGLRICLLARPKG